MDLIVLAGGLGTRLQSVVSGIPKPMAEIRGKPFLDYLLKKWIKSEMFSRVILSVGYKSEIIMNHFGNGFLSTRIEYLTEENPLGTGGAIKEAGKIFEGDCAVVINGDTYVDIDVSSFINKGIAINKNLICITKVKDTSRYGTLKVKENKIYEFTEKSVETKAEGFINTGCYFLKKNLLLKMPENNSFSFEKDFISKKEILVEFEPYVFSGQFIDIGIPDDYYLSQKMLLA